MRRIRLWQINLNALAVIIRPDSQDTYFRMLSAGKQTESGKESLKYIRSLSQMNARCVGLSRSMMKLCVHRSRKF